MQTLNFLWVDCIGIIRFKAFGFAGVRQVLYEGLPEILGTWAGSSWSKMSQGIAY
jgi:hypothetical protein